MYWCTSWQTSSPLSLLVFTACHIHQSYECMYITRLEIQFLWCIQWLCCCLSKCLPIHFHFVSCPTIAITNLSFKNCLVASSFLLNYCNKSVFTSSDAGLPDDKHISFSMACSCMSKGFWQFKNPICSCWTSFSLFLSSRGLQSDFLKSTACYILTDGSHIGLYRMWKAPRWITTLSDFTESLLQT